MDISHLNHLGGAACRVQKALVAFAVLRVVAQSSSCWGHSSVSTDHVQGNVHGCDRRIGVSILPALWLRLGWLDPARSYWLHDCVRRRVVDVASVDRADGLDPGLTSPLPTHCRRYYACGYQATVEPPSVVSDNEKRNDLRIPGLVPGGATVWVTSALAAVGVPRHAVRDAATPRRQHEHCRPSVPTIPRTCYTRSCWMRMTRLDPKA